MATELTVYSAAYTGTAVTTQTSGSETDWEFVNDGNGTNTALIVENGSASPVTLTFDVVAQIESRYTGTDNEVTIAAGATKVINQFTKTTYNQTGVAQTSTQTVIFSASAADVGIEYSVIKLA